MVSFCGWLVCVGVWRSVHELSRAEKGQVTGRKLGLSMKPIPIARLTPEKIPAIAALFRPFRPTVPAAIPSEMIAGATTSVTLVPERFSASMAALADALENRPEAPASVAASRETFPSTAARLADGSETLSRRTAGATDHRATISKPIATPAAGLQKLKR